MESGGRLEIKLRKLSRKNKKSKRRKTRVK